MDQEFRYVGPTPSELEGGRPIEPGEFTGPIDVSEESPQNKLLLDEGRLLPGSPPKQETATEIADRQKREADAEATSKQQAEEAAEAQTSTGKAGESS